MSAAPEPRPRLLFVCYPDTNHPIGGVKQIYRQVELLHQAGWSAWVLTPELKLPGLMRLKESRRVPLFNGAIECRLFRFDMVAGSAR